MNLFLDIRQDSDGGPARRKSLHIQDSPTQKYASSGIRTPCGHWNRHAYMYLFIYLFTYLCVYMCMYLRVYMCVRTYVRTCVCACMHARISLPCFLSSFILFPSFFAPLSILSFLLSLSPVFSSISVKYVRIHDEAEPGSHLYMTSQHNTTH